MTSKAHALERSTQDQPEAVTGVRRGRMTMFSFFKRTTKAVVKIHATVGVRAK